MIIVRPAKQGDVADIERLAQIPGMFNLPSDPDLLREKIEHSEKSFKKGETLPLSETKYLFVAEDTRLKRVVGTSMIAGQHGTKERPHFYFQVGSEEKVSKTLGTGFIHGTLELKLDTDGPSELGGLVLDPEFRNSEERVGRQLSFVRFLFAGMFRSRFRDRLIAELLPPLNKRGQSPLWEAIGRRFTNMDYWEADQLCQQDKEFILSLFPNGKIYTAFLAAEARNAIGKVGKDTAPVKHMLEKIGFKDPHQVDPFDGGPHLWARIDELVPIRLLGEHPWAGVLHEGDEGAELKAGLLALAGKPVGEFRAVHVEAAVVTNRGVCVTSKHRKSAESLGIRPENNVVWMPYY